jgi:hypothetical protein
VRVGDVAVIGAQSVQPKLFSISHFPNKHGDIPKEVMLGITPNVVERLYTKRIVYNNMHQLLKIDNQYMRQKNVSGIYKWHHVFLSLSESMESDTGKLS